MKKKLLLIISMFLFITNVKALTFNVNLTDIEDKGSGSGSVDRISVADKELDISFQGAGDEVNFELTITNSGDRAGILKSISITSTNNKISYTTNLPGTGLAINGNGTNKVLINAKVLEGATSGTSTSTIKLTYNYDEGSCPEGEILSEDETMCLCPNGKVRNEKGLCIDPPKDKDPECEEDEIYNETKKICEKVTPPSKEDTPTPENPKTLDNIILIAIAFLVSGLGIYLILFKKLQTKKQRIIAGIATSGVTMGITFVVLASVFGLDNLLGAIVNPITKSKEIIVTVNESITTIETWDGSECAVQQLDPENIFDGGSGTESDPYQIRTAEQLVCFAKSINGGETYQGKFVKQTSDIKLNDNLVSKMDAGETDGVNVWISAGVPNSNYYFGGTYDGDNKKIMGILISANGGAENGMFGYAVDATFKNMILADTYVNVSHQYVGSLVGRAYSTLILDNITTYGKYGKNATYSGGIIGAYSSGDTSGYISVTNTTNNIDSSPNGIIGPISIYYESAEPNVIFRDVTNNGTFRLYGGIVDSITGSNGNKRPNVLFENVVNNGDRHENIGDGGGYGGLIGRAGTLKLEIIDSGNTGELYGNNSPGHIGGLAGVLSSATTLTIENCYNSGNITTGYNDSYSEGLTDDEVTTLRNANPAGTMGGLVGEVYGPSGNIILVKNSYNTGTLSGLSMIGGLVGINKNVDDHVDANILIDNCYNTGDIRVGDGAVGGIIASTKGTIKDSYNKGNMIIWAYRDHIYDPYHKGTMAGGLVGKGDNSTWSSDITGATIKDSYNEGDILITAKTTDVTVGGICGLCTSIINTDNHGNIISRYAPVYINGIAYKATEIVNSNFDGQITTENLSY